MEDAREIVGEISFASRVLLIAGPKQNREIGYASVAGSEAGMGGKVCT
jgi:hypothetical protein